MKSEKKILISSKLIENLVVTTLNIHTFQVRNWSNRKITHSDYSEIYGKNQKKIWNLSRSTEIKNVALIPQKWRDCPIFEKSLLFSNVGRRIQLVPTIISKFFFQLVRFCSRFTNTLNLLLLHGTRVSDWMSSELFSSIVRLYRIHTVGCLELKVYMAHGNVSACVVCICIWEETVPFVIESKCALKRVYFDSYAVYALSYYFHSLRIKLEANMLSLVNCKHSNFPFSLSLADELHIRRWIDVNGTSTSKHRSAISVHRSSYNSMILIYPTPPPPWSPPITGKTTNISTKQ